MSNLLFKEKLALNWIYKNPKLFKDIHTDYFKDEDLKGIYGTLKKYYLDNKNDFNIGISEIVNLVKLDHTDINSDVVKTVFNENLEQYSTDWVESNFLTWKGLKDLEFFAHKTIDLYRSAKDDNSINPEKMISILNKLKDNAHDIKAIRTSSVDMGLDFDDPTAHIQLMNGQKITTGYKSLDKILGGGWDLKTLTVLQGQTNVGKCCLGNTKINVKNKHSGEIFSITIEEFFNKLNS